MVFINIYDIILIFVLQPPKPEDLSIICFTSGTTGKCDVIYSILLQGHIYICEANAAPPLVNIAACSMCVSFNLLFSASGDPKGVMMTHENVVSDAGGVVKTFEVLYVSVMATWILQSLYGSVDS